MYRVVVEQVRQKRLGGLKYREVLDFATDSFPAVAAEISKYRAEDGYRTTFYDNTAYFGLTPDFHDHGDGPSVPPARELLDDELAAEEAGLIDKVNASYGEVPF